MFDLAKHLGEILVQRGLMLATAESCTGGWVAETLTAVPGSSAWFDRGFVTYSNEAKQEMLGVASDVLEQHGAVSRETAVQMAEGVLRHSRAGVSLATTGVAGPGGGSVEKPVGTVWFAWAFADGKTRAAMRQFDGDRESVRRQAVEFVLRGVIDGGSSF